MLLGEVHLNKGLSETQKLQLADELDQLGFELIDNHRNRLMEQIKQATRDYLMDIEKDNRRKENLSDYLSHRLNYEYSYISDLFSCVEGATIENYFIQQRIERAKYLLVYDEKNTNTDFLPVGTQQCVPRHIHCLSRSPASLLHNLRKLVPGSVRVPNCVNPKIVYIIPCFV